MRDALVALEGPLVELAEGVQPPPQADQAAVLEAVWRGLRETVDEFLAQQTLEDLAQRIRQREGNTMYYI